VESVTEDSMAKASLIQQQMKREIEHFVDMELDIGMTFAEAARYAESTHELLRNRRIARQAFDVANGRLKQLSGSLKTIKRIATRLGLLRVALVQLGDPCRGS
jgi:hypothetical protein